MKQNPKHPVNTLELKSNACDQSAAETWKTTAQTHLNRQISTAKSHSAFNPAYWVMCDKSS